MRHVSSILTWGLLLAAAPAFANTAAQNREAGAFSLGGGYGLFISPVLGASLAASYAVSPDLQIEARGASGTADAKELLDSNYDDIAIRRLDLKAQLYELRAKYYFGNSFYVGAGLGQRHIEADLEGGDSYSSLDGRLESTSDCLQLAIGNIWTFDDGFFIGGEWIALNAPLNAIRKNSLTTRGVPNEDVQTFKSDAEDAFELLGRSVVVGLATLQLGYQF